MRLTKTLLTLSLATLLWPLAALSDDTDIYINNTTSSNAEPLVMFSIDYRANLTSNICSNTNDSSCTQATYFRSSGISDADIGSSLNFFDVLRLSLKVVLQKVSGVKIGLMLNHNNENRCAGYSTNPTCSNGGTILMGFQSLSSTDTRATFLSKLDKLKALKPQSNSADHPYQGSELFFEFFRYLTGQGIYNGHNGAIDYEKNGSSNVINTATNTNPTGGYAPASWDDAIENGVNYRSPLINATACTKLFTINFLFQVSQNETESENAMFAAKSAGGTAVAKPSSQNDYFPAILRFLNQADLADGTYGSAGTLSGTQNVTSYFFIKGDPNTTTNGYATAGGTTRPYALTDDPGALVADLIDVFQQILSVSTTFVSASVPVNVFNRAALVDNVYIALFQADADAKPYWNGNIKKLKIKQTRLTDGSVDTFFSDARDQPAVASDGRIKFDALTYWTNGSVLTDADATKNISVGRDGREVPRGGAGQKTPGFVSGSPGLLNTDTGARKLFYDSNSSTLAALNADDTTATALQSSLAAADSTEALSLLRYARGLQPTGTAPRTWIFGDPLHSRPLPINYGVPASSGYTTSNPAIYLAVANNDGYLRFIRNTDAGGAESGVEVWGFMPRSVMPVQKVLLANTPVTDPVTGNKHPYTFDGAPVSYVVDANGDGNISTGGSDRAYLYASLRRGGSAYYGLNVTDPVNPTLMWTITNATTSDIQTDFREMGLSFSTPKLGTVLVGTTVTPALFFAGGFDGNKDAHALGTDDTKGRAIYAVNALTGALIWKTVFGATTGFVTPRIYQHSGMLDSIPSDLAVADTDGDTNGLTDRILVADTGGRVWRVDLTQDGVVGNWKTTLLADLGRHVTSDKANDRRFFYPPDIVQSRDSVGNYDAVVLGSGDREDPLDKGGVTSNYLYVLKDRAISVGGGSDQTTTHATLADVSNNCLQGGVTSTCNPNLNSGWKLALTQGTGEKNLAAAVTFSGAISFNTYLPSINSDSSSQSCGPSEGSGLRYVISLTNGTAVQNFNILDDATSSDHTDPNSAADRFEQLRSSGIPGQSVFISTPFGIKEIPPDNTPRDASGTSRFKTFWQRQQRN